MNKLSPATPHDIDPKLIDAAHFALGYADLGDYRTLRGLDSDEAAYAELVALGPEADRLAVRMQQDGRALEQSALIALGKVVTQLGAEIESGAMSAGALVRVADLLYKISGLGERQAERARVATQQPEKAPFSIVINFSGDQRESKLKDIEPEAAEVAYVDRNGGVQ